MFFFDFRNREESQKHFFANGRFSGLFFVHRLPDNRNLFDNPRLTDSACLFDNCRLTDSPCLIGNLSVTCRNDERLLSLNLRQPVCTGLAPVSLFLRQPKDCPSTICAAKVHQLWVLKKRN